MSIFVLMIEKIEIYVYIYGCIHVFTPTFSPCLPRHASIQMGSIEDVVADNRMSTESLPFRIVSETDGRDNDLSGPLVPPSSSIKGTEEDVSSDSDSEYAGPSRPSSSFASSSMSASENQEASLSSTDIGPEQKRRKMRDLEFEHLYVDALPCAEMYERSYMHRDAITKIVFTKNQFLITASSDGFVQFWRKMPEGIEFVKKYRAHLGPVVSMSVSSDSSFLCTASTDKAIKVFDVLTFGLYIVFSSFFVSFRLISLIIHPSLCSDGVIF